MSIKHPEITVELSTIDDNAMSIMIAVERGLKLAGVSQAECLEFRSHAMSGDFDNLIQTSMDWVNVT